MFHYLKTVWGHQTRSVRDFLQSEEGLVLTTAQKMIIEDSLPSTWRALIREHGHEKVFECLRAEMTTGGAMFYLREGHCA